MQKIPVFHTILPIAKEKTVGIIYFPKSTYAM